MRWNGLSRGSAAVLVAFATGASPAPACAQASWLEGWHFGVTPYVWMAALEGDAGVLSNLPTVEVDASFSDILDHTDLALMLALEARYQRFGAFADIDYMSLSADGSMPGPLFGDIDVDSTSFFATIGGFYRAIERDAFAIDLVAGMRVWSIDTELKLDPGLLAGRRDSDHDSWVDPLIGARGNAVLGHGFSIIGYGDMGGFGSASEFTWQLVGTLNWEALDWLVLRTGYRHLEVDYQNGGFVWDVAMTGPIIGAALRF